MQSNLPDPAALAVRDRVLAGDRQASEDLCKDHLDGVYEFVHYRLGGDRATVEDLVQDTFLVAIEKIGQFDGRSSIHTWLCGIAKNKIRSHRRKPRPRPIEDVLEEADSEIDAILASVGREPLPEWVLEREETRELVGATLSSLPPEYKSALLDKYVGELSVAEMASRRGKGVKATESMLQRARVSFGRVFELVARRRGGVA